MAEYDSRYTPVVKNATIGHELSKHAPGLESVVARYGLSDTSFTSSVDKVIADTDALLKHHRMDPDFLDAPGGDERGLFAMAIADVQASAEDPEEHLNLDYVLHAVSVGEKDEEWVNYSGRMRDAADKGNPKAQYLDPRWLGRREKPDPKLTHEDLISNYIDQEQTEEVLDVCSQWGEGTVLHHVRTNLGIKKEAERPYKIFVVKDGIDDAIPGAGAYCRMTDVPQIVLPTYTGQQIEERVDIDEEESIFIEGEATPYQSLEHEYAHSQSSVLSIDMYDWLFRGVNEGITEANVLEPCVYDDQREILTLVKQFMPNFPETSNRAYMGNKEAQQDLLRQLINIGGSAVFLAAARLIDIAPKSTDQVANLIKSRLLRDSESVKKSLLKRLDPSGEICHVVIGGYEYHRAER